MSLKINHVYNDVSYFEIHPGTSFASMRCGSESQKRTLLSATQEIVLYLNLLYNRSGVDFLPYKQSHPLPRTDFNCEVSLLIVSLFLSNFSNRNHSCTPIINIIVDVLEIGENA